MDWKALSTTSHYQTAVAVKNELMLGNTEESINGIEELIDALSRSERRALRSQLIRLMMHVIKWKIQSERRCRSWLISIENARVEIEEILEEEPHLKPEVPRLWGKCFSAAIRIAKQETGIKPTLHELSEEEVFVTQYALGE